MLCMLKMKMGKNAQRIFISLGQNKQNKTSKSTRKFIIKILQCKQEFFFNYWSEKKNFFLFGYFLTFGPRNDVWFEGHENPLIFFFEKVKGFAVVIGWVLCIGLANFQKFSENCSQRLCFAKFWNLEFYEKRGRFS